MIYSKGVMNPYSRTEKSPESPSPEVMETSVTHLGRPVDKPEEEYLSGTKLAVVFAAVIVSIFLDALVINTLFKTLSSWLNNAGPLDHCNGNSKDN